MNLEHLFQVEKLWLVHFASFVRVFVWALIILAADSRTREPFEPRTVA
jgi:hypothetical protein